jgi:hypothetical protein
MLVHRRWNAFVKVSSRPSVEKQIKQDNGPWGKKRKGCMIHRLEKMSSMPWNAPDNVVVGFGLLPLPRVYGAAFVDSIIGATQIVGAMFPLYLQVVKHGNRCLFCIARSNFGDTGCIFFFLRPDCKTDLPLRVRITTSGAVLFRQLSPTSQGLE